MLCTSCILSYPMVITRTMLKMTHSFCRYTRFTCESINYNTHVKINSHLSYRTKTSLNLITDPLTHTQQQVRQLAYARRLRMKRPHSSSNRAQAASQMNNHLLPSVAFVANGGQLDDDQDHEGESGYPPGYIQMNQRRNLIPLDFRSWEEIGKPGHGNPFTFCIVSYNVLAQNLLECHPYLYTGCDHYDLTWKARSEKLFKEIMDLNPDILCLQEVQSTHIRSFYGKFEQKGYYGIFKKKTGLRNDGCAIYYKKDVFDLEAHLSVEYFQPAMQQMNRDNVGVMVRLRPRGRPRMPLVVATTHLLYNPARADVRLAQMQLLLAELDRFAHRGEPSGRDDTYYPIILTGDFNSTPKSAVVELLDNGSIFSTLLHHRFDWRRLGIMSTCQHLSVYLNRPKGVVSDYNMLKIYNSDLASEHGAAAVAGAAAADTDADAEAGEGTSAGGGGGAGAGGGGGARGDVSEAERAVLRGHLFNSMTICHPLRLASVYARKKRDGEPEATTYQEGWVNVDYMYYSYGSRLRLVQRLRMPRVGECNALGRLPNDVYASDHLLLAAHFELRPPQPED